MCVKQSKQIEQIWRIAMMIFLECKFLIDLCIDLVLYKQNIDRFTEL